MVYGVRFLDIKVVAQLKEIQFLLTLHWYIASLEEYEIMFWLQQDDVEYHKSKNVMTA